MIPKSIRESQYVDQFLINTFSYIGQRTLGSARS